MTWIIWRQYRVGVAIFGTVLAAIAVVLLITGLGMASQYHAAVAGKTTGSLSLGGGAAGALTILTMAVPLVAGMFWGAPTVARELESGTSTFAWTQSVTRRRWLTARVGWLLLAGAVFGGAIAGLVTWWYTPVNALNQSQFGQGFYDIQGIVPIGYAVFAVALGIAAGTMIGRSLPALAVTAAGFLALRFAFTFWLRERFMTPVRVTFPLTLKYQAPAGSWVLSQGTLLPDGQGGGFQLGQLPAACRAVPSKGDLFSCLSNAGYRGEITYQPGYRFWPFQFIETGIFVALAGVLVAVAFLALRRKDA
jgi:hypothetical protein